MITRRGCIMSTAAIEHCRLSYPCMGRLVPIFKKQQETAP